MGSSEVEISSLSEAELRLNEAQQQGISALLDDSIQGISHTDIVQVLRLLVKEQISAQKLTETNTKETKQKLDTLENENENTKQKLETLENENEKKFFEAQQFTEEKNEETKNFLEAKVQHTEQKLQNLDKALAKTNKESKGVEARAGVPAGQALSVEERDQLDFFLQSPGIGMVFLAVAFGVSGEDASGALQAAIQKGELMKMAEQVADEFPGFTEAAEDAVSKVKSDMQSEFKKVLDFAAEVRKNEAEFVGKIHDGLAAVVQTAGADLKVVFSTVQGQMQSKSDFFRETVLPSIVHELKANASSFEDKFEQIERSLESQGILKTHMEDLRHIKNILKNFEIFFASDLYEKFLSEIIANISKELKKFIKEKVVHLQRQESTIQADETAEDDSGSRETCMNHVKECIGPMLKVLAENRKELWKNIMDCISTHPFTVESTSDMPSKSAAVAAPALAAAKAKVLQDAERKYLHTIQKLAANLSKKLAEPIFDKIPDTVLHQMLKLKNFKIEEFFTHQIISYELEYLGTELKSRLKAIFVDKLQKRAQKIPQLKLFLDVVTEAKGYSSWITQLWHRSWKIQKPDEETKRHGIAHGLSNMVTVALFLFVLVVQFGYLFFVFYEQYQVYDGGLCPGYNHWNSTDNLNSTNSTSGTNDTSGASKEIRILVGFVGAYLTMKNGSKLSKHLKALEGNRQKVSSGLFKLLPFANMFMNCPAMGQVENVMKEGLMQLIIDSARSLLNSNVPSLNDEGDKKASVTCNNCFGSKKPSLASDFVTAKPRSGSVHVSAWAFGSNSVEASPAELSAGDPGRVVGASGIDVQIPSSVQGTALANLVNSNSGMCAENRHGSGEPPVTVSGMRFGEGSPSTGSSDPAAKPKIKADTSQWRVQEVSKSKLYHVFCIDVLLGFVLTSLVVLNNMYIIFVAGGSAQDILKQVVILDFILVQAESLKKELFSGASGKAVLRAIKAAFEYGLDEDTEGRQKQKRDKSCGANTCRFRDGVCCCCGSNATQQSENPNLIQKSGKCCESQCSGCKRPLKHLCAFCCCSSTACVGAPVHEEHSDDPVPKSFEERNEAVRQVFEFVIKYVLGVPLMSLTLAFVFYAPICKPGDVQVVNITVHK